MAERAGAGRAVAMPIYTTRTNLLMNTDHLHRGDYTASMSHHFFWPSDEDAIADFATLPDHYKSSAVARLWTAGRGYTPHEMILFRRDLSNARSFVRLANVQFLLPEYRSLEVALPGTGAASVLSEAPIYRHSRGAILVTERGFDTRLTKRTYVGPISPTALQGRVQITDDLTFDSVTTWYWNPFTNDDPAGPNDSVDVWRTEIAELACDHIRNLHNDFTHDGYRVLVSWKQGLAAAPAYLRGSLTRADLLSRSVRGGFTEWRAAS